MERSEKEEMLDGWWREGKMQMKGNQGMREESHGRQIKGGKE